ncbi:MAG: nicotinate (nicotinamide) nucleotide adenylyltransferase [Candidatus Mycalebacterium zealandia]|nr:MAG: nicotinate (nicotinamide) nucleotide adenylyltransferase [Candidatus Mycalebacterium zealandia]
MKSETVLSEKTALLGGSFDPVHNGHMEAAVQIRKKLGVGTVFFVPNYQNPLKDESHAPPGARLEMLRLATEGVEGVKVSDVEMKKKSSSYTVETLRLWKEHLGEEHESWFIMGWEVFKEITKWKDFRKIFEVSNIVIIPVRVPGNPLSDRPPPEPPLEIRENFQYGGRQGEYIHKSGSKLYFEEIDTPDISSTQVRNLIKEGGDFESLVPNTVADFIKREKLYLEEPRK